MREVGPSGRGADLRCAIAHREGALDAAAATGLPVCLMHMRGEPGDMQNNPRYGCSVVEASGFLVSAWPMCAAVGIAAERIILDPGFGFAKTLNTTLACSSTWKRLHALVGPLLVGVSRKSMIGSALGARRWVSACMAASPWRHWR